MTDLRELLKHKILILDGAMGTMIQRYNLSEEDYRGTRFTEASILQKGNNDILSITRPDIIESIHTQYLEAGADIIETNTFNANSISMTDYGMENEIRAINQASVRLARKAADVFTWKNPEKPRFIAASIGPTNKTLSMSPDVSNPAFRNITFDELYTAYKEQIAVLIEEKVDILLIETVFDTLNAKAALVASSDVMREQNREIPIMLSFTIAGKSGRILSGQTLRAALASVSHIPLLSVGLNCSFGASDMKPFLKEIVKSASCYISAHPNAGLPNSLGAYDETPQTMASQVKEYIDEGLVNIIGGCCGTTPDHIHEYVALVEGAKPHQNTPQNPNLILSGLDELEIFPLSTGKNKNELGVFINIGERCNVAGSRKFLRLIKEKKYDEALEIARKQVDDGAHVLDINVDDGLLDGVGEMTHFLNLIASEPEIARVPIMVDSSDWKIIEAGLKVLQGKSIVNSISLKNGEADFLEKAQKVKLYGAAVIAMAFDEKGQADSFERKIEVCERMYRLLTEKVGFRPVDIIFDPNVLAIATGIEEHNNYALDFIRTVEWIKENLPGAKVSGGVSNLSFSFRGQNYLREAIHAVFLYHSIQKGLDMGIVNPSSLLIYEEIPADLRNMIEDLIFNRRPDAAEKLIEYAQHSNNDLVKKEENIREWRQQPVDERLKYALLKGNAEFLSEDISEALTIYHNPIEIINKPLMEGMNQVGELFGQGKMFLPQVVKTARTMRTAVSILQPEIEKTKSEHTENAGKILLATVKGDVHDIGKNITGVILSCNNYEIIDIGVMVPPEEIIAKAKEYEVDIVALSGLITPSLQEMAFVASEMEKAGFSMPLLIGGATTSKLHTALKIAPLYHGPVVQVSDASQAVPVAKKLLDPDHKADFIQKINKEYESLRNQSDVKKEMVTIDFAREHSFVLNDNYLPIKPKVLEKKIVETIDLKSLIPYINWLPFLTAWKFSAKFAHYWDYASSEEKEKWKSSFQEKEQTQLNEAIQLLEDAKAILEHWLHSERRPLIRAVLEFFSISSIPEGIRIYDKKIWFLRQQEKNEQNVYKSLADFFCKKDYIGLFAVSVDGKDRNQACSCGVEHSDDHYTSMINQVLQDRLVEAAAEYLHEKTRKEYWGYAPDENFSPKELIKAPYNGIRPASGYPVHPDVSLNFVIDEFLDLSEIGVTLTQHGALFPTSSIAGMYIAHPQSDYFRVGNIGSDQIDDYARKRELSVEEIRMWLGK